MRSVFDSVIPCDHVCPAGRAGWAVPHVSPHICARRTVADRTLEVDVTLSPVGGGGGACDAQRSAFARIFS